MLQNVLDIEELCEALNYVKGTLLICDRNRNIVYYNDVVCTALDIEPEKLDGANLMDLAREGYITNSASIQAFETKELSIKYVQGRMEMPILTVSNPVLDEDGSVRMVVAVSLSEEITEGVTQQMMESRQLLDYLAGKINDDTTVIAESSVMQAILAFLRRISMVDSNILLTGETGTGKEVLAKYIHNHSSRKDKVFIPVNCAAIPENLMESEFFGYVRGAFTGANKEGKAGVFEMADGGTVFLDEIGEMPLNIQGKFLRVIESGEVMRLGSAVGKKLDFRLITATNRDLEQMSREGTFRSDLYYRLNILSVELPPLRERREDIIPIAKHFLAQLNKKYNKGKILSYSASRQLEQYNWPGNVRELRNVMERLYVTSPTSILTFENLFNNFTFLDEENSRRKKEISSEETLAEVPGESLHDRMEAYERQIVMETVSACDGNVAKAAKQLKLHRSVLYRKLEKYKNHKL